MIHLQKIFLLAIMFGTLSCSTNTSARAIWEKDWIELKTPNFTLFSELSEKDTRQLAWELEAFRSIVISLTNMQEATIPKIPTYITVFRKRLKDLGLSPDVAGFLVPGLRANYVVIFHTRKSINRHAIQHEYTHFLMRNFSTAQYPTWFDEGLSEFLATIQVKRDHFTFGDISRGRVSWLLNYRWTPYEKLIVIDDLSALSRNNRAMYYAQAWVLVHYLIRGRSGKNFFKQNAIYLDLRKNGIDKVSAFEQAYELEVKRLSSKLRSYLERKMTYTKARLREPFNIESFSVQPLDVEKIANRIGELCFVTGEFSNAEKYFQAALSANPQSARAYSGMGDVYKFAGEMDKARPYFDKTLELDPENALNTLDVAQYYMELLSLTQSVPQREIMFEQAQKYFKRSLELDNNIPETHVSYAHFLLSNGRDSNLALERAIKAHRMLPSHPDTKITLARAYIETDFKRPAIDLLKTVLGWSHSDYAEEATRLMRQVDPDYDPEILPDQIGKQ